mgnify:CR=1 FL=1
MEIRRWIERLDDVDGAGVPLEDLIRAEIARAGIALAAARTEAAHWKRVAEALDLSKKKSYEPRSRIASIQT